MYVAIDNKTKQPIAVITAANAAAARSHLARKTFDVKYADQQSLFAAFKANIVPEIAGAEPAETAEEDAS